MRFTRILLLFPWTHSLDHQGREERQPPERGGILGPGASTSLSGREGLMNPAIPISLRRLNCWKVGEEFHSV